MLHQSNSTRGCAAQGNSEHADLSPPGSHSFSSQRLSTQHHHSLSRSISDTKKENHLLVLFCSLIGHHACAATQQQFSPDGSACLSHQVAGRYEVPVL